MQWPQQITSFWQRPGRMILKTKYSKKCICSFLHSLSMQGTIMQQHRSIIIINNNNNSNNNINNNDNNNNNNSWSIVVQ